MMNRQFGNDDYQGFDNDNESYLFVDNNELSEQQKQYKRNVRQLIDDRLEQRRIRDEFGISESDFAKLYH
jgi:DNA-binding transcriptional regulator YiaG